jgi:hypothetical protein
VITVARVLVAAALVTCLLGAGCASRHEQTVTTEASVSSSTTGTPTTTTNAAPIALAPRTVSAPSYRRNTLILEGSAPSGAVYDYVHDCMGGKLLVDDTESGKTIVSAESGKVVKRLPGPQRPGWFMGNIDFSERWAVWYETPVSSEEEWALYCLDLEKTEPQLLSSAISGEVQFPLFSLVGDRVVWYENRHQGSQILSATLYYRDLSTGDAWQLQGTDQAFDLPQIVGDRVWWMEYTASDGTNTLLRSAALADGQAYPPIHLQNSDWVYYWPAVSESGAVAWIVRGYQLPDEGTLYVQMQDGRRFSLEGTARTVRFIGDLLVYDSLVVEGGIEREIITAVDLETETKWIVEASDVGESGDSWTMAIIRSRPDNTLVLQRPYRPQGVLAGLEVQLVRIPES